MALINALRDFGHLRHDIESRTVLSASDRLSHLNAISMFYPRFGRTLRNIDNTLAAKSKRGWEDFPIAWRRSPKRALDVVRRLWRMPEIRKKYINFLKNIKRSDEVLENTPVQTDKADPTWMWDEVGYDVEEDTGAEQSKNGLIKHLLQKPAKRGWEDLNSFKAHLFHRNPATGTARDSAAKGLVYKRGWEDIVWKRSGRGLPENENVVNTLSDVEDTLIRLLETQPINTGALLDRNSHGTKNIYNRKTQFSDEFLSDAQ